MPVERVSSNCPSYAELGVFAQTRRVELIRIRGIGRFYSEDHEVELISAKRSGQSLPIGQNFLEKVELQVKKFGREILQLKPIKFKMAPIIPSQEELDRRKVSTRT
jgi:hypothetical protein